MDPVDGDGRGAHSFYASGGDRTHRQVSAMRRIEKAHATQSQVELLALLQRERYRLCRNVRGDTAKTSGEITLSPADTLGSAIL